MCCRGVEQQRTKLHVQWVLDDDGVLISSCKVVDPCGTHGVSVRDKGNLHASKHSMTQHSKVDHAGKESQG